MSPIASRERRHCASAEAEPSESALHVEDSTPHRVHRWSYRAIAARSEQYVIRAESADCPDISSTPARWPNFIVNEAGSGFVDRIFSEPTSRPEAGDCCWASGKARGS